MNPGNYTDIKQEDLLVSRLGEACHPSPLTFESASRAGGSQYVCDAVRLRLDVMAREEADHPGAPPLTLELAGPCEKLFFDPGKTSAAVLTCGGLSPGLNNVIYSLFYELTANYGVSRVLGIRNGFLGLNPDSGLDPVVLDLAYVEPIHKLGGTVLGTSRGPQDPAVMVDFLETFGIDIVFCIGGDGTQRGALALHEEIRRREARIAIVGVPKTIDNDIPFVGRSFGYATALEKAGEVIRGAHIEARAAVNGIGLVKLMGRHAGFIAAGASIVSQEVDFTLVPEIPFPLEGEGGFLAALEHRMRTHGHAVIVVAEGAGRHLFTEIEEKRDRSGNVLQEDIGGLLRGRILDYFSHGKLPITLKYLDPSYFIRSVPAGAYDRMLCDRLARHAVHAAMAGKTGLLIGL
nr:ATP-dependent 6-phosphofructokinase [Akkermansiaceae bacterium]